jgi:hypothetical protein
MGLREPVQADPKGGGWGWKLKKQRQPSLDGHSRHEAALGPPIRQRSSAVIAPRETDLTNGPGPQTIADSGRLDLSRRTNFPSVCLEAPDGAELAAITP